VRALLIALALIACSTSPPTKPNDQPEPPKPSQPRPATYPRVTIATPSGDVVIPAEVVASEAAVTKGMMFRQFLAPDEGMLFLMGQEKDWNFFMQNTLIPLDMIFITKDLTVAGVVHRAVPLTEDLRSVGAPSLYVLEVNGGFCASRGVAAGAKVTFANVDRNTAR